MDRLRTYPVIGNQMIDILNPRFEYFNGGGASHKKYITGGIEAAGSRGEMSFVEREYNGSRETYIRNWLLCRKVGLPVVAWIRKTEKGIIMPDLTADGSHLYGKAEALKMWYGIRTPSPLDGTFLDLMGHNKDQIMMCAKGFAEMASAQKVALPRDETFELWVHPDGIWELLLLDLECMEEPERKSEYLEQHNYSRVGRLEENLSDIAEILATKNELDVVRYKKQQESKSRWNFY